MIGLIVTGHGAFPSGMLESVELMTGKIKQIKAVPFEEDQNKLRQNISEAMDEVNNGSGVVCLTDLSGGTPFNVSSQLAVQRDDTRVIGGTNVPMLLSAVFQRELALDLFTENLLKEGKDNIKDFKIKSLNVQETEDGI